MVVFIYYWLLTGTMWDREPVLYWRICQNGKMSWQKAKAALTQMGLYAIEPPRMKVNESEGESDETERKV